MVLLYWNYTMKLTEVKYCNFKVNFFDGYPIYSV